MELYSRATDVIILDFIKSSFLRESGISDRKIAPTQRALKQFEQ